MVFGGAYGTVFHQQHKATECATCKRAHVIGTNPTAVTKPCDKTSLNKMPIRGKAIVGEQTSEDSLRKTHTGC